MIIHESMLADEYKDESTREYIRKEYKARYTPKVTPLTYPQNYDPCEPPNGWRYDPYYEIWLKTNNE